MPVVDAGVITDVADRLFAAIENGDVTAVQQMWSDAVVVWKTGDHDRDKSRALRVISWFVDATTDRRYEIVERDVFAGGFVQQHILHASGRNGGLISMRVCLVVKVGADGLISRIDEYFDPAELAPLLGSADSRGR